MRSTSDISSFARLQGLFSLAACMPGCLLLADLETEMIEVESISPADADSGGLSAPDSDGSEVTLSDVLEDTALACSEEESAALLATLYEQVQTRCEEQGTTTLSLETFEDEVRSTDCLSTISCTYNPPCFEGFVTARERALCQPDTEDADVSDTADTEETTPDVIITDATDADEDSSPDAEDADVHEETSDTGDTSPDVIITDATDADGDTSPDAEDADVTDTTDSGDTTPDTEIPDTTPVCGDGICEGDEEDCEADCGPRIVTLTVNVHPNDDAWIHRLLGVPNRIRIERYNPFDDAWEFVGYPGQVLPTSPGEEFRIITTVPSLIFGSCASNYTVPDDCTSGQNLKFVSGCAADRSVI